MFKRWKKPDTATHAKAPVEETDDGLVNPFQAFAANSAPPHDSSLEQPNADQHDPELIAALNPLKKRFSLPHISRNHASLLAFQAGSFGLRGALIQPSKAGVTLLAVAQSRTVDFTRAIGEVLDTLRHTQKRLPKRAILLTPSVVSAIVELPVSPLRPRSNEQMQELIRWELEGAITQQNKHWMIGSMLIERGYLTIEQRDEVLDELQLRQTQGGPQSLLRFGDLAVQLGLINRSQLEECFALQGKLVAVDDDLVYGWQPAEVPRQGLSDDILLSQEDDSDSSYAWLVSGMSQTVRRRWVGAFNLNHIHLESFYPTLGSAFSTLPIADDASAAWLLEIHQEQLALLSGHKQVITTFQAAERQPSNLPSLDECLDLVGLLPANATRLYLNAARPDEVTPLLQPMADALQVDIQPLSAPQISSPLPEGLAPQALSGISGAASHFLEFLPQSRVSAIAAREKTTSMLEQLLKPQVLLGTAATLVITAMFGFLGWMHWNAQLQTQRLNDLDAQYTRDLEVKQKLEALYNESLLIKSGIAHAEDEIKLTQTLLNQIEQDRSHRAAQTAPLLKAIVLGMASDVALKHIEKSADKLTLQADIASPASGQEYVNNLSRLVRPINFQVANSASSITEQGLHQLSIELTFQPGLADKLLSSLTRSTEVSDARTDP